MSGKKQFVYIQKSIGSKKDISSGSEAEDVLNVLRNAGIGHDFESTIRLVKDISN